MNTDLIVAACHLSIELVSIFESARSQMVSHGYSDPGVFIFSVLEVEEIDYAEPSLLIEINRLNGQKYRLWVDGYFSVEDAEKALINFFIENGE
jgi:hypothetical protein